MLAEPAPHGTFLAMHHPPIPVPMLPAAAIIELDDQQRLAELLAGTDVRMILGGHFHYSSYSTFAGIPVSVASATCYLSDIAPHDRFISAVDADQSVNMVHVYADSVVTSIVPTHDSAEISGFGSDVAPLVEAMSFEERREMFSRKDSDFNRHDDDPIRRLPIRCPRSVRRWARPVHRDDPRRPDDPAPLGATSRGRPSRAPRSRRRSSRRACRGGPSRTVAFGEGHGRRNGRVAAERHLGHGTVVAGAEMAWIAGPLQEHRLGVAHGARDVLAVAARQTSCFQHHSCGVAAAALMRKCGIAENIVGDHHATTVPARRYRVQRWFMMVSIAKEDGWRLSNCGPSGPCSAPAASPVPRASWVSCSQPSLSTSRLSNGGSAPAWSTGCHRERSPPTPASVCSKLADSILDLEDRLALEVADAGRTPSGHVRLAAPDSLCAYRLAPLVATMRAELPDIRVTLAPAPTRGAVDALRSGDCEAALLLETALRAEDLRVKRVGEEALVMVADTPRARRTWAAMAEDDFLLLEEGCCYSNEVERRLQAAGQPPERRLRFGSIEAVKACVAAGMGVSVLPRVAAQRELEAGLLVTVDGPLPPTPRVFAAVHARRTPTAATLTVLERLAKWWRVGVA